MIPPHAFAVYTLLSTKSGLDVIPLIVMWRGATLVILPPGSEPLLGFHLHPTVVCYFCLRSYGFLAIDTSAKCGNGNGTAIPSSLYAPIQLCRLERTDCRVRTYIDDVSGFADILDAGKANGLKWSMYAEDGPK
jgi:hypothetical protein